MNALRILACQIAVPKIRDASARDAHLENLARLIAANASPCAQDVIVLPELSSIEYSDDAFDRLALLEEPLQGPSFRRFSELAAKLRTTIVYGFPRRGENGRHICQAAVGPDGRLLGWYDKLHIAQFGASAEAAHFQPGDKLFVFEVAGFKLAPMICYDIRFADLAARLAAEGVDVVLQSGAYYRDVSFHSWRPFVVTRAIENSVAWLGLNRAGENWGGSIWCPGYADDQTPEDVLGREETFWRVELPANFKAAAASRLPFQRDRRNDYSQLSVAVLPEKDAAHE